MGPSGCGKSCLIKRYCEGRFVSRYISTIGIDYGVKDVNVLGRYAMLLFTPSCQIFTSSDTSHTTEKVLCEVAL